MKTDKLKVYTSETISQIVSETVERRQVCGKDAFGFQFTKTICVVESAEFTGKIEVYLDLKKLMERCAGDAFRNKRRRSRRGPVEARVVDMKEVPGARTREERG